MTILISEYVEGSGFNKAIELFNAGSEAIDLGSDLYTLELFSNGAAAPTATLVLTGTLASGGVLVLANPSADASLLGLADVLDGAINHNGDDSYVLRKDGQIVDSFGQVGVDPGTDFPGGSANVTLRRIDTVFEGDPVADDAFSTLTEYTSFASDTFDGLGSHTVIAPASFDLQVTEIWSGQDGEDVTADWFEISNQGDGAWVSGVDAELFYDDVSASAADADPIQGITDLQAGELAIVVIGDADDAAAFVDVWDDVIDLDGVEVGFTDGAGLGGGGDAVNIFVGDPLVDGVIVETQAYPDTDGNNAASFDVATQTFSTEGVNGAVATTVLGGDLADTPAVASPGNGQPVQQADPVFTLELLHFADQEASTGAIVDAPNLSAVLNALRAEDLGNDGVADNTLTLSSGDAFIPGVFFDASQSAFANANGDAARGVADIQIQNELGVQAIALGNHEFDRGTAELAALIDGSANGTILGQDFAGTDFTYLSANLDVSTDANLAPLAVAGGQASQAGAISSSVVLALPQDGAADELIGVVGATTPTLGRISSPGDVTVLPDPFGDNPSDEDLDALAAIIQAEVDALLAANPDMDKVIVLAHMQQIAIEEALATRLSGVDVIVAGGSNTRLFDENDRIRDGDTSQGDYPKFFTDADGNPIAVVNTDGSYKYVGRLVLDFDADGHIIADSYDADVSGAYATDDQGVADLGAEALVDPEIQAIVDAIEAEIIATESNVFGVSDVFLNGNRSGVDDDPADTDGVRTQETNLGNLTADANLAAAQAVDAAVVISIKNGGGIRASVGETVVLPGDVEPTRLPNGELLDGDGNVIKPAGGISQNDIATSLAFNNELTLLSLTRQELIDVLEHGIGGLPGVAGRFPQVSGVVFSFDPDNEPGSRIVNAGVFAQDGTLIAELMRDGELVGDATETFRIVTLNFLAGGGDGYPFPQGEGVDRVDLADLDGDGNADETFTGDATFAADGTEQDALAEYLDDNFADAASAFAEQDTGRDADSRIQNLNFRGDGVFGDIVIQDGLFETFDNADGFVTSAPFFSDGAFDYFGISDGAAGGDFGGDPAPNPDATTVYTGNDGAFLVGSDLDGEGAALPITLLWEDIGVAGFSSIQFAADFAEALDDSGPDASDFVRVEIALDDGGFETILEFRGDAQFNGLLRVDTDGDGLGDGAALGNAFTQITADIDQTATTADLRITLQLDAGFEDIAIDNVQIREAVEPPFEPPVPVLDIQLAGRIDLDGAEIVDFDAATQRAFVTSSAGLQVLDVSDIGNPVVITTIDPASLGFDASDITSVSVSNGLIAVARPDATVTDNGQVLFYSATTLAFQGLVLVDALPDMLVFNDDGTHLLVANEGQSGGDENQPDVLPNPEGSVSVITINTLNPTLSAVTRIDFTDPSLTAQALADKGVRLNPDAPSVAADIEPEYITIEGNTAFIALQENNAVAVIQDITNPTPLTIDNILALGTKDHSLAGNGLDASNQDDAINIDTYDIQGLFMPDGMASYTVGGQVFFLTANEGDGRDVDESRGADLVDGDLTNGEVDLTAISADLAAQLADDAQLGRLKFSNVDGDTDGDGLIEELHSFGARSFTIFDADGNVVFDSGDDFEQITAALVPEVFNSNGDAGSLDSRSDDKGPEPEAVVLGQIDGQTYAFIALERTGGVMVYDVTDPANATFEQYIRVEGDIAPEGLLFIPAEDSPNGTALLAVANEESNTLTFLNVELADTTVLISQIQGETDFSGNDVPAQVGVDDVSPLAGQVVTIEAIVTADFQSGANGQPGSDLSGFFVQEEEVDYDLNAFTSEGLFIFDDFAADNPDVQVGDLVRVTGTVEEFFGQTQISADFIEIVSSGNTLPAATEVTFPTTGIMLDDDGNPVADLEAVEGMLITIPTELSVTEMFNLDRFGEIKVSSDGRLEQFTQNNAPDADGFAQHLIDNATRTITLDDGRTDQNPEVLEIIDGNNGVLDAGDSFRMGDTITNVTGVLNYAFDEFRVQDATGDYQQQNPRPDSPDDIGGTFTVASLNVLNFFTTIDLPGAVTDTGLDPRGADSDAELARQTQKLVNAIVEMDADILGLIELENSATDAAISVLVDAVNDALGADVYDFIATGLVGGDAIAQGLIYKTEAAEPVGGVETLIEFEGRDFIDPLDAGRPLNRPAIAQTFRDLESGETITVAVNHLKSKGSLSGLSEDEAQGDGQGNNNATRTEAASILADWLASDPTGQGAENVLIIGDLNAYAQEDPITLLESAGFTDIAGEVLGEDASSFVFDGQTGTLDYALANDPLLEHLAGVTEWHINADEADAIDYNLDFDRDPALFNGDSPARNSDHDPVIVSFDFTPLIQGTDGNDALVGTAAGELIEALAGDDLINGGGGADTLDGGAGSDIASYADAASGITVDLTDASNNAGEIADDTLISIEGIQGAILFDNSFTGGDGADIFLGGSRSDVMLGGAGRDVLVGDLGNDTLDGGNGQDILLGGFGSDVISGGGADGLLDVFIFERNHNDNVITDFQIGEDIILFQRGTVSQDEFQFDEDAAGVILSLASGSTSIQFLGLTEAEVTTDIDNDGAFDSFFFV